jgi:predicted RNase H-like HicB family nuclease
MVKTFNLIIYFDEETKLYWATCPELKGCNTQGKTIEEIKANMKEAISLCLEDCTPENVITDTVTLEVAHA